MSYTNRQQEIMEKIEALGLSPEERETIKNDFANLTPEEFERRHNRVAMALGSSFSSYKNETYYKYSKKDDSNS